MCCAVASLFGCVIVWLTVLSCLVVGVRVCHCVLVGVVAPSRVVTRVSACYACLMVRPCVWRFVDGLSDGLFGGCPCCMCFECELIVGRPPVAMPFVGVLGCCPRCASYVCPLLCAPGALRGCVSRIAYGAWSLLARCSRAVGVVVAWCARGVRALLACCVFLGWLLLVCGLLVRVLTACGFAHATMLLRVVDGEFACCVCLVAVVWLFGCAARIPLFGFCAGEWLLVCSLGIVHPLLSLRPPRAPGVCLVVVRGSLLVFFFVQRVRCGLPVVWS